MAKYTAMNFPRYTCKLLKRSSDIDVDKSFYMFDTLNTTFYEGLLYASLLGNYAITLKFYDAIYQAHLVVDDNGINMITNYDDNSELSFQIDTSNLSVLDVTSEGTDLRYGISEESMRAFKISNGRAELLPSSFFTSDMAGSEYCRLIHMLLASKYIYQHDFGKSTITRSKIKGKGKKFKTETIHDYTVTGNELFLSNCAVQTDNNITVTYKNLLKLAGEIQLSYTDIETLPLDKATVCIKDAANKPVLVKASVDCIDDGYLFSIQNKDASLYQFYMSKFDFYEFGSSGTDLTEIFKQDFILKCMSADNKSMINDAATDLIYDGGSSAISALTLFLTAPLLVLNYIKAVPPKKIFHLETGVESEPAEAIASDTPSKPRRIYLKNDYAIPSVNIKNYRRARKSQINYFLTDWSVRGHYRHYKDGRVVWIKPCNRHRKCLEGTERVTRDKEYQIN